MWHLELGKSKNVNVHFWIRFIKRSVPSGKLLIPDESKFSSLREYVPDIDVRQEMGSSGDVIMLGVGRNALMIVAGVIEFLLLIIGGPAVECGAI